MKIERMKKTLNTKLTYLGKYLIIKLKININFFNLKCNFSYFSNDLLKHNQKFSFES